MIPTLPLLSKNRLVSLAVAAAFQFAISSDIQAQCAGNLLVNPGFESPAMTLVNGNNIMGPGNDWGGWSCTNGGLNILRVQGHGYASGANNAADGNQYVDVANSDGYIYQRFSIASTSPVYFSGSFSNRESGWGNYVNWTGRIDILDSMGVVVASSNTRSFVTTDNNETWYTLTGSSSNLAPGTYTYRSYIGNSGHFDNAAVCALANAVLPVKIKSFTASIKGSQVMTNWAVGVEENIKGYELQYSSDGINFKGIEFISATNSNEYSLVHKTPSSGFNYYRLKTHDQDGKTAFTQVCKVNFSTGNAVAVYPNPATGYFHLSLNNDMVRKSGSLVILNMSGAVIQQRSFAALNQTETIDIQQLGTGTYFVRMTAGTHVIHKTLQVIK